ncbi:MULTISPECIES: NADH-quinone oxidoreductase subunit L [Methylophaga]|uniref:NADH-quinone oxidoreductase subunit L n=1 Tax=Methylophaga TaxID=40222 RepID=UPI002353E64A|nr:MULTISPECIES: NADH-quinone oxidoreductase subunit L [Methylophaga]
MNLDLTAVLPVLIPLTLSVAGLLTGLSRITDKTRQIMLKWISAAIMVSAIVITVGHIEKTDKPQALLAMNNVNLLVLLLVCFMAIVLIKFSQRYLFAEKNTHRYWRWLFLSLTSVSVVIVSNHLLLFWLGWVSISLCFHRLLLFYPDRPRAVLAAHKKFILARVAEIFLLSAIVLLYSQLGTFYLAEMTNHYLSASIPVELSLAEKCAAIMLALTALIKCAQLPLHGWLIQVVEAPTPISALLHAGIINLGGFLLLSFAPLIAFSSDAQWLILIIAGLSTLISALVMMTRISIKVKLAWSTCAQMGLMLIECALGLHELALLHLISHSLYKAYMFLSAGDVLQEYSLKQLAPQKNVTFISAMSSLLLVVISTYGIVYFTSYSGPLSVWLLVNTALALYLVSAVRNGTVLQFLTSCLTVALLVGFYMGGKTILTWVMPPLPASTMFDAMDIWLSALFVALFLLAVQVRVFPQAKATRTLYRWLFSGLYLDELMTRLTLFLWPITLRPETAIKQNDQSLTKEPTS